MKYLIQMKDYSTKEKNDFCSTFYTLKTFWEYQPNHLKKDILDRKSKGQDYSTVELTHLFYNIVEAATYIYEKSHSHGDIRPSSIAVLEEGKSYKLVDRADPSITPLQAQLNHIYSGKENYVSPQIYQALKKGNLNINPDKNKSDVYSLALCILEAGLKKSISTIYDETSVNEKEIEKLLNEFNNKYPENILLITSLKSMLLTDESARPSFKDILARIPTYNEIIEYFSGQEQYYSNDGTEDFTSNTYDNYQPDSHYARNEQEGKFGGQNPDPYAQSQPKRSPPQTNNYSQDQEIDQYAYKQPKSIAKGAPPPQNNNYYDNDQYNGGYDDHHPQTGYDNQNQYNQE